MRVRTAGRCEDSISGRARAAGSEKCRNGSHSKQAMPSRATDELFPVPFSCRLAQPKREEVSRSSRSFRPRGCPRKASGSRPQPRRLPHSVLSWRYRRRRALWAEAGRRCGRLTPDTVMGIVSLILWALLLIVALKYAILILRADNHGEGGIVALLALLEARRATQELACLPAHRRFDRAAAALWRRRDHAGDFGTQRYRRSQDRRAGN